MDLVFTGRVVEWRGPAPYYFVPLPDDQSTDVRAVAALATYGWGVIPVVARIGDVDFQTSLIPRNGGYLLPVKKAVRLLQAVCAGDEVVVELSVRLQGGR